MAKRQTLDDAIRAILFDADGVVQHATDDLLPRLEAVMGFVPKDLEAFFADVFDAEAPALIGTADFAERLIPVVGRWGAPGTAQHLAKAWCSIQPDLAVLSVISNLRASGLFCGLATNQQSYRAQHMDDVLGYSSQFDRTFYSCRLGVCKPNEAFFTAMLDQLPFRPAQVLFVDDREENVVSARAAGLTAVQFVTRHHSDTAHGLRSLLEDFTIDVAL